MRLLLYNIRYAVGGGASMHMPLPGAGYVLGNQNVLPEITRFIKSVDPDIVGLIEVDTGSIRSRMVNQAEKIASDLGMNTSYRDEHFTGQAKPRHHDHEAGEGHEHLHPRSGHLCNAVVHSCVYSSAKRPRKQPKLSIEYQGASKGLLAQHGGWHRGPKARGGNQWSSIVIGDHTSSPGWHVPEGRQNILSRAKIPPRTTQDMSEAQDKAVEGPLGPATGPQTVACPGLS